PNPTPLNFRTTEAAWYFQDEMKLRPNLTVRLGLRYEMTTGWNERDGISANYIFDPAGDLLTNPLIGRSSLTQNNALALWQPRVGVAWDPTGTGKWAVRAGFGIHNDLLDNLGNRMNSNPPFNGRLQFQNTSLFSIIPIASNQAPLPQCQSLADAAVRPRSCSQYAPAGVEPSLHTPTIQEWSLEVERELMQDLAVEVSYVGSQSYHLSTSMDMNAIRPLRCENPAGCLAGGVNDAANRATVPQGTEYVPVGLRRNPLLGNSQTWMYLGNSSYHAGAVSLTKRSRGGLTFRTNYTFSKVLDMNSAILGGQHENESGTILNPHNLGLSKGVASYHVAHRTNTSFGYDLPFGRGKFIGGGATGWVDKLIGGWQWQGVLSAQSGFPILPLAGSNQSGNGDSRQPDVPNRNPAFQGNAVLGVDGFKKTGRYFDPNAFLLPLPGTFGNVGRGVYFGPGQFNVNTSFFKNIPVKEGLNLQFRTEIFNLLNHANFDTPELIVFEGANPSCSVPAAVHPSACGIASSGGQILQTTNRERQIQFALRLEF
ncbi:MAG: carboxypeptidase regulatory-like domain-containing protein, partial [Terriglobia bacterium]